MRCTFERGRSGCCDHPCLPLGGSQDVALNQRMERSQGGCAGANLVGQRRHAQIDAFAPVRRGNDDALALAAISASSKNCRLACAQHSAGRNRSLRARGILAAENAAARTQTVQSFQRKRPSRKPFPDHLPWLLWKRGCVRSMQIQGLRWATITAVQKRRRGGEACLIRGHLQPIKTGARGRKATSGCRLLPPCGTWLPQLEDLEAAATEDELSRSASVAQPIDYMLERWDRFARFIEDGRVCLTNNAAERALRGFALGRKSWLFAGSERGADRAAAMTTLIMTALCRARHKAVYADCRTMPNGFGKNPSFARTCGWSSGRRPSSIRHSLASYSASRKASRRSLGWKRSWPH